MAYNVNHLELKACLWGIHGERGQETLPGHGVEISWAAPFTRPSRVRRKDPRHYPIGFQSGGSVVPDWLRPGRIREFWLVAVQAVSGSLIGCCWGTTLIKVPLVAAQAGPYSLIGCSSDRSLSSDWLLPGRFVCCYWLLLRGSLCHDWLLSRGSVVLIGGLQQVGNCSRKFCDICLLLYGLAYK